MSRRPRKPQQSLGAQPGPPSGEEPASCISCSPRKEIIDQVGVAPHCARHELPSKSRAVSRRLAAVLHKRVEATENVALLRLGGLWKTDHALNAKIPTRLSVFGDALHTGRDGAWLKRVLVEHDEQLTVVHVERFVEKRTVPVACGSCIVMACRSCWRGCP